MSLYIGHGVGFQVFVPLELDCDFVLWWFDLLACVPLFIDEFEQFKAGARLGVRCNDLQVIFYLSQMQFAEQFAVHLLLALNIWSCWEAIAGTVQASNLLFEVPIRTELYTIELFDIYVSNMCLNICI